MNAPSRLKSVSRETSTSRVTRGSPHRWTAMPPMTQIRQSRSRIRADPQPPPEAGSLILPAVEQILKINQPGPRLSMGWQRRHQSHLQKLLGRLQRRSVAEPGQFLPANLLEPAARLGPVLHIGLLLLARHLPTLPPRPAAEGAPEHWRPSAEGALAARRHALRRAGRAHARITSGRARLRRDGGLRRQAGLRPWARTNPPSL